MIDVLLATYNGAEYLRQQIDSIINQSFQSFRLIIHDDGSNDETRNIIRSYTQKMPDKVFFLDDDFFPGGAKKNFSYLLNKSSSSYIMFSDQDDIWLPEKLEKMYNKILELEKSNPELPILVHSDLSLIDETGTIFEDSFFFHLKLKKKIERLEDILVENSVSGCAMIFNRKAVNLSSPIPNEAMMHDWWISCQVMKNRGIIYFIDEPLVYYRQHSRNVIGAKKAGYLFYIKKLSNPLKTADYLKRLYIQIKCLKKEYTISQYIFDLSKTIIRKLKS